MTNPKQDELRRIAKTVKSNARMILYTHAIGKNGKWARRDDLWAISTDELNALLAHTNSVLEGVVAITDENRVDVEATEKHMLSKGASRRRILNMQIEADDMDVVIDGVVHGLHQIIKNKRMEG